MTQSVTTNRLGRSTLWTTIATAVNIGLLMLQLAILSRQFPSEIFGQFAVINVFVEIFTALATGGIASYLMYRKDLNQVEKNSVYALAMLFGLFCFLIFSLLSPFILQAYGYPELGTPMRIIGVMLLVSASAAQYQAIALQAFQHAALAKIEIVARISSFIIAMLTMEWELYCLVISTISYSLIRYIGCVVRFSHLANLSFSFQLSTMQQAFHYGMYTIGGQLLNIVRRELDSITLAAVLPLSQFGIYHIVKQIAFRPASAIQPIITRISFPALAHVNDKLVALKQVSLDIFLLQSCVLALLYAPLLVASEMLITLVYGASYREHHWILALLGACWLLRIGGTTLIAPLSQVTGKPKYNFYWNIVTLPITSGVIYLASFQGVMGVCIGLLLLEVILFPLAQKNIVMRIIPISLSQLLLRLYAPLAFAVVIYGLCVGLYHLLPDDFPLFMDVFVLGLGSVTLLLLAKTTTNPIMDALKRLKTF